MSQDDFDNIARLMDSRNLTVDIADFVQMAKALGSDIRVKIWQALARRPMNVVEIAETFDLPISTAAINVRKLEEVGLIDTAVMPGSRGTQKLCSNNITNLIVKVGSEARDDWKHMMLTMPVGNFVDCQVTPTCGMVSELAVIGEFDDPRLFYDTNRTEAQLVWFRRGYVEYRFANRVPRDVDYVSLELCMELCSEAPMYNENWPSDITVWVNGVEIGTWTSPGDFGGKRGILTPAWWGIQNTQFGLLKAWRVTSDGSFVDGIRVSDTTLSNLDLASLPYIAVRIGVKPDAENEGGMNIFGRKFGNYETDIMLRIDYR